MSKSKRIRIGNVYVGGGEVVRVEGMLKSHWDDTEKLLSEAHQLERAGAELIRVAVPTHESLSIIEQLKKNVKAAIIADVHFNESIAAAAIDAGADKVRINPANVHKEHITPLIDKAKKYNIPIRIGVNTGSFKKTPNVDETVGVCLDWIEYFEESGFELLVVSAKSPDVISTVQIYRKLTKETKYPLHIGLTEAGAPLTWGLVGSAIAIATLLQEGIGDIIRVSLTAPSDLEVKAAYRILQVLGLRKRFTQVIACPTCGRCEVDLIKIVESLEEKLDNLQLPTLKVAVMGCVVNGPGEARSADLGVAWGKTEGLLFSAGKPVKKIEQERIIPTLIEALKNYPLS